MHVPTMCVFPKQEVALITGWVVLWIVDCAHTRAACKITLADVLYTLVWQHGGDTGYVTLWTLQGLWAGGGHITTAAPLAVPNIAALGMSSQAAFTRTNPDLSVSNFINSNLNKMAREIKG